MPYRIRNIVQGHYYHIYNRGAYRQTIFFTDANYQYCLRLIVKNAEKFKIGIAAYCLMPNHYHLLIRHDGPEPFYRFVQNTFNSYVQALNKSLDRKGPLFEGRFKHVLVNKNEYLMHLVRYIHLNPVQAGLAKSPESWLYSNYLEYVEKRNGKLSDFSVRDMYFESAAMYERFVKDELKEPQDFYKYSID